MNNDWKRNIVLFLASQTISLFGSCLVQYAITWHITMRTQSGVMMTVAIICGFLPTFFVSPFGGVLADRYDRKVLIMLSDSLIALSTLVLAILFFMGYDAIWLLFVVLAVRAIGAGVQQPAIGAILPQLVPEENLTKVNATNGSIQAMIMLVSPMLSGALLTVSPIETIFFIDVVTAAIAVLILLLFLPVAAHAKALSQQTTGYFADMRRGIVYINKHDYLKSFFLYCAIFFFLVAPAAFLTPLQVTRSFGNDVWRLTAVEVAYSIGMMAGGLIIASWGGFKNKVHTVVMACLGFGVCTVALGVVPVFWIYLGFMVVCGLMMPFFNTPATVLLQEKVESEFLGRVFGVLGMITSSMMPFGMLVFGPVADVVRIEWLLVGTGVVMLVVTLFVLGDKALIEAGKPLAPSNALDLVENRQNDGEAGGVDLRLEE